MFVAITMMTAGRAWEYINVHNQLSYNYVELSISTNICTHRHPKGQ
jgi:hypothetical protein